VPLKFKWSSQEALDPGSKIQLSQDKSFKASELLDVHQIKDNLYESVAEIPSSGEWYWRLSKEGKPLSQERSFKNFQTFVLNPTSPKNEENVGSVQKNNFISFGSSN
jgi:hypothetical protein